MTTEPDWAAKQTDRVIDVIDKVKAQDADMSNWRKWHESTALKVLDFEHLRHAETRVRFVFIPIKKHIYDFKSI